MSSEMAKKSEKERKQGYRKIHQVTNQPQCDRVLTLTYLFGTDQKSSPHFQISKNPGESGPGRTISLEYKDWPASPRID